jgi:two-component system, NtrC family, nitrogen regulation sensor histidine kinase NtrY
MSTSGKIRLLLAMLFASLLFTAIVVQSTYTPAKNLDQTAKILQNNLQRKEGYIAALINDRAKFDNLKNIQQRPQDALKVIQYYTTAHGIWLSTFKGDSLMFWSGIKVIPQDPSRVKEGVSFIREPNGYYETIKKSNGDFSVIFSIPVKINYVIQNEFLRNKFAEDLISDDNIELADYSDTFVRAIHSSINDAYLFSVRLKPGQVNHLFYYFELVSWILTFLTLCILIHTICKYLVTKQKVFLSLLTLAAFITLARFINLHFHYPSFIYQLNVFKPGMYAANSAFPSLGDFCLNMLFATWFFVFLHKERAELLRAIPRKVTSYFIIIGCITVLLVISALLLNLFYGLVINSNINFDLYNVFNLSKYSMLGLFMLCFGFLIFYLLNETVLSVCMRLPVPDAHKITLFVLGVIISLALITYYQHFNSFFILVAVVVIIRGHAYRYRGGEVTAISLLLVILVFSLVAFLRYRHIETTKELNERVELMRKLQVPDDVTADHIFKSIEKQILSNHDLLANFGDSTRYNTLKSSLQKLYFDGYLSSYSFNVSEFDTQGQPIHSGNNTPLSSFEEMVIYSSYKVSDYFYRANESFSELNYFAILPISRDGKPLGTLVIDMAAKPVMQASTFPELLEDASIKQENEFKDYSYAFYSDNKLMNKSGTFGYDLVNNTFKGKVKQYTTAVTQPEYTEWYKNLRSYNHLIYMPNKRNMIVVTREQNPIFYDVTSLTFFFILLLAFSLLAIGVRWLWLRIRILNITETTLKWKFRINFDRILYKTRIQFSIIAAVVVTLIFVGFITFFSISQQYTDQQQKMISDKISHISAAFTNGILDKYLHDINDESQIDFDNLANTYSTDLTLYDLNGIPIISTEPRVYEYYLQPRRMNARAFIQLSKLQKSMVVNDEKIGELSYKSAYAPLVNRKQQTVGYLQLPYFSDLADYNSHIASLLNVMINVYAIIFLIVGLFAIIIARQITAPLSFMQYNLGRIAYGRKNEPIIWERDDEIGALVNEYNKMISALENSAQKLAQSERESAWREMAKQVAHEIKNPLTPLKLGLQLLEKSWRDKDPKFDQKFERFSKSFVEQIESLSSIASEFSSFAKMPDTHMERLNIFDMLSQAVTIFVHMENIKIIYNPPEAPFHINADRDQLLRCFNNLLKNAIEAKPVDKLGVIDIGYLITSKNILISMKDNGNGIPELLREKIFEPNFTTKSSGTGLGLAFVKNSIENAGGKVWFETAMGVGTTFYLSFPSAG